MTDPKQIDWSSEEAVVKGWWPFAFIEKRGHNYRVLYGAWFTKWYLSESDAWTDARQHPTVQAFERQHNPQHAPAQLTWQEKRDAVIAKFPQAFDCHWEKEGWHAIFSLPLKDPAHQCLHSEEARGSYDYPFLSEEAAWVDAFKFLFPTTTAPQERNDGTGIRADRHDVRSGISAPDGPSIGDSDVAVAQAQEVASVEPRRDVPAARESKWNYCPFCGKAIWGEGWTPQTGTRHYSHKDTEGCCDRIEVEQYPRPAATPPPALPESGELPPRPKTYSLPTDGGNVALNFCKPEEVTAWIDAAQSRIAELAQHATRMEGLAQAHFESARELESELSAIRQQRGKGVDLAGVMSSP